MKVEPDGNTVTWAVPLLPKVLSAVRSLFRRMTAARPTALFVLLPTMQAETILALAAEDSAKTLPQLDSLLALLGRTKGPASRVTAPVEALTLKRAILA